VAGLGTLLPPPPDYSVAWCRFPATDREDKRFTNVVPGHKARPTLVVGRRVITVRDNNTRATLPFLAVCYGSSRAGSDDTAQYWIKEPSALRLARLNAPTRFNLLRFVWLPSTTTWFLTERSIDGRSRKILAGRLDRPHFEQLSAKLKVLATLGLPDFVVPSAVLDLAVGLENDD
jgi:hypothetical protein